jgi:hypothetical protein
MTRRFGDRSYRVWVEILSIADRYDGLVPGASEYLGTCLAGKCQVTQRTVLKVLEFAESKLWIVSDPVRRVRNHLKYRPTRGDKQIPEGKQTASPPLLHTPTLPTPKALKRTMSAPADRSFLNGFDALWKSYPEPRGSKDDALKAYKEKKPPPEALEALKAQIAYKAECDTRDQFWPQLPHLVRWIKKRRWTDEIPRSQQHDDPLDREIKRIRRDIHGDKETD